MLESCYQSTSPPGKDTRRLTCVDLDPWGFTSRNFWISCDEVWWLVERFSVQAQTNPISDPFKLIVDSALLGKHIIIVSLNYRLNIFAFGDGEAINLGLSDIQLGIEWVKKHIECFGGNPVCSSLVLAIVGIRILINSRTILLFSDKVLARSLHTLVCLLSPGLREEYYLRVLFISHLHYLVNEVKPIYALSQRMCRRLAESHLERHVLGSFSRR